MIESNQGQFSLGSWRIIEFDMMHVNGEFTIFNKGDETVLTAVTRNMTFFEPAPEPERASSLGPLFR